MLLHTFREHFFFVDVRIICHKYVYFNEKILSENFIDVQNSEANFFSSIYSSFSDSIFEFFPRIPTHKHSKNFPKGEALWKIFRLRKILSHTENIFFAVFILHVTNIILISIFLLYSDSTYSLLSSNI